MKLSTTRGPQTKVTATSKRQLQYTKAKANRAKQPALDSFSVASRILPLQAARLQNQSASGAGVRRSKSKAVDEQDPEKPNQGRPFNDSAYAGTNLKVKTQKDLKL
jgi:hypothetical protein